MNIDDIVLNKIAPEFGVGVILEIEGENAVVHWENFDKAKIMRMSFLELAGPGTLPPKNPLIHQEKGKKPSRPNLAHIGGQKDNSASFSVLVDCFIRKYPAMCDDPEFIIDEYGYKEKASFNFKSVLAPEKISSLLEQNLFSELVNLAMDALSPKYSNLLDPQFEAARLKSRLKTSKLHERFARALYRLLDNTLDKQITFNTYADLLGEIKMDTWPVTTLPLFLLDYEKYICVKPFGLQYVASSCDRHIDTRRPPTWEKYGRVLDFATHLKTKLERETSIHPKDMIDLQSFIYVCHKYK